VTSLDVNPPVRRRWSFRTPMWGRHPGVRHEDQLTLGERAADALRSSMGSWPFVFGALIFLAVWMLGNRNRGFDPYPFILLNLVLSCLAAMQGAILLIAAKRSDQIASELAQHDYQTDQEAARRIELVHDRIEQLAQQAERVGRENQELIRQLVAELAARRPAPGEAGAG
jgi:uncharacterized membrane protein